MKHQVSDQLYHRSTLAISLILVTLTLGYYWSTLAVFLLNAPDSDDYVDILWFFEVYMGASTLLEKISALLLPIHEHTTLSSHLIYLFDYWLFKKINFAHYILAGQLILLCICLIITSTLSTTLSWLLRFTIVVVLYINLAYWHSSFWAMTAISNQIVILFALLAALTIHRDPNHVWLAMVFAILGCFSQANGLAIFIAMAVAIYFSHHAPAKKLPHLLVIAGLFVLVLVFYFIHQNPLDNNHHLDHQLMATEPQLAHLYQRDVSNNKGLTFSVVDALLSFLILCGATVFHKSQTALAASLGMLVFGFWCFVYVSKRSIDRFTQIVLVFTLISIILVALGRSAWFLDASAMQPRYRMYSFLLLALTARQLLQITQQRRIVIAAILFVGLILQISSRHTRTDMATNQHSLTSSYYYWLVDGGFGRTTMSIYPPNQDRRLFIAYNTGRYNPIDAIPERHKPRAITQLDSAHPACTAAASNTNNPGQIQSYSKKPKAKATELTIQISDPAWPREENTALILCTSEHTVILQLDNRNLNTETNQFWSLLLLKTQLSPGSYSAYLQQENRAGFLGNITIK